MTIDKDKLELLIYNHNINNSSYNLSPAPNTNTSDSNSEADSNSDTSDSNTGEPDPNIDFTDGKDFILNNGCFKLKIGKHCEYFIKSGYAFKLQLLLQNSLTNNQLNLPIDTITLGSIIENEQNKLSGLLKIIQNNIDMIERYKNKFECRHRNNC